MVEEGSGIAETQTDKFGVTWTAADERLPFQIRLAVFVESKDDVGAFTGIDASAFFGSGSGGGSQRVSFVSCLVSALNLKYQQYNKQKKLCD